MVFNLMNNESLTKFSPYITILIAFIVIDVVLPLLFNIMGLPLQSFIVYLLWCIYY